MAGLVARLRRRPTAGPPGPRARRRCAVTDLAKTYKGGFSAVKGVSFTVERGMVLGLLGPNGAGKTTVLRMLMGLIRPTAGTITAFGEQVRPGAPVLARIGAFVEGPGFLPHLSGAENLRAVLGGHRAAHRGGARRRGAGDRRARRVDATAGSAPTARACGSGSRSRRPCSGCPTCSCSTSRPTGSTRRRSTPCARCCARYAATGRTVLVSSHLLAEVEQTCSHVVVMHQARWWRRARSSRSSRAGAPRRSASTPRTGPRPCCGGLDGVRGVRVDGDAVHAELNGTPRAEAVRALVAAGVDVTLGGPAAPPGGRVPPAGGRGSEP